MKVYNVYPRYNPPPTSECPLPTYIYTHAQTDMYIIQCTYILCLCVFCLLCVQMARERSEARPQVLKELLAMDLDAVPIKDIKAIMIKLGVSPHDCFERTVNHVVSPLPSLALFFPHSLPLSLLPSHPELTVVIHSFRCHSTHAIDHAPLT